MGSSPTPATIRRRLRRSGITLADLEELQGAHTKAILDELANFDGRLAVLEGSHRRHHDPGLEQVVEHQGRLMRIEALYRSLEARVAVVEVPREDRRQVLVRIQQLLEEMGGPDGR